ncbi:hypothetical protein [Brochothrix thermosphacta]|uniref:hypothetical protein n=1 Tax=Brochothrix thermosphacta TaxID=2756 RepID=UPI003F986463
METTSMVIGEMNIELERVIQRSFETLIKLNEGKTHSEVIRELQRSKFSLTEIERLMVYQLQERVKQKVLTTRIIANTDN